MKIYLSNYKIIKATEFIAEQYGAKTKYLYFVGYGRNLKDVQNYFPKFGIQLVDNPEEADLELFLGPVFLKMRPDMRPNVIMTMYEFETLPDEVLFPLYNWENLWVPSSWVKQIFEKENLPAKIFVCPLGIDVNRFKFIEREPIKDNVYFLHLCTNLNDRKGSFFLIDAFSNYDVDEKASLIIKASGFNDEETEVELDIAKNIFFIKRVMSEAELYDLYSKCHIIIHPSIGEGFGMPPLEGAATGMLPLPGYSTGMMDWINEIKSPFIKMHRKVFESGDNVFWEPDLGSIIEQVNYWCENKDDILRRGKFYSEEVTRKFSWEVIIPGLIEYFEDLIYTTPKEVWDDARITKEKVEELIDLDLIMNIGQEKEV